jgi:thioesterase domain-containing protein/acyl carrier protein
VLELGLNEGILSYEGAEVLERILDAGVGPQVIVSPQDLVLLMTRLREASQPAKDAAHASGTQVAGAANRKAPTTPTEQLIAQMWGELLGVENVSADDNFFDLGGHSLLAVQVINRLRKRTGKSLPLTALLEAPTVEQLAALVEPPPAAGAEADVAATSAPRSGTMVTIREGGSKTPVFFVHDGNGETLLYRTLALQLDDGHPVYGLQPEMRADSSYVHTRIVDMAAAHVRQLREVQPHGPYLLAGLCAGGVISFEMARQLQDAGETTLFVGIIDGADVAAEERSFRLAQDRLQRFLGTLGDRSDGPAIMRIGKALPTMVRKTVNYARYEVSSRLEQSRNARRVQGMREVAGADGSATAADEPGLSFLKMYEVAHKEHQPQGLFDGGDVVVFRATEGDGSVGDVPYVDIYADEALGWRPRVAGTVQVVDIPGGHSSALQEPHVGELARKMQQCIDAALSKASPPDDRGRGHRHDDRRERAVPVLTDEVYVTAKAALS